MGKFEQEASKKVLAGEQIVLHTTRSLKAFLLFPWYAFKNWQHRKFIRKFHMHHINFVNDKLKEDPNYGDWNVRAWDARDKTKDI
jgi:hypothetical protein